MVTLKNTNNAMPTISMAPEELESSYNRLKVGILERVSKTGNIKAADFLQLFC